MLYMDYKITKMSTFRGQSRFSVDRAEYPDLPRPLGCGSLAGVFGLVSYDLSKTLNGNDLNDVEVKISFMDHELS
jgi:hypothetical protein